MQFINNKLGRVIAVNVGADKMTTVLPGQLISLPLEIGLEVGLTPIDDFRQEQCAKPTAKPVAPAPPQPNNEKLLNQLNAAMDTKMDRLTSRLLGALAELGGEDLRTVLQKLDALTSARAQAATVNAVEGTSDKRIAYVPLQEGYREKKIEADTSGLKVEKASATADTDAADELDALLGLEDKS